jgi:hypothetical protein
MEKIEGWELIGNGNPGAAPGIGFGKRLRNSAEEWTEPGRRLNNNLLSPAEDPTAKTTLGRDRN